MDFVRVVKNSDDLQKILPFTYKEDSAKVEKKNLKGALSKYKNEGLQAQERDACYKTVVDDYENS